MQCRRPFRVLFCAALVIGQAAVETQPGGAGGGGTAERLAAWRSKRVAHDGNGRDGEADAAEQLSARFDLFTEAVCRRCADSGVACGCELGRGNPPFEVLHNYATQYSSWREAVAWPDEQPKWIVINVQNGLGNNLLAYVNGLLLALCLGRALAIDQHDAQPMHPMLDFVLEADIPPWHGRGEARLPSVPFFLDQALDLSSLTCTEMRELEVYHVVRLLNANQDPHLVLGNPRCGAYLHETFRGMPFFFLSHFVWPAYQQRDAHVSIVSSPLPQPWDGRRSLRELLTMVHASVGRRNTIGMHVRVCRKIPLHHYDHSHLLPQDLDRYCSGDETSLDSMATCLRSFLPPAPDPRQVDGSCGAGPPHTVVLWATDNDLVTARLRRAVEAECGVVLVRLVHEGPGHCSGDITDAETRSAALASNQDSCQRGMEAALADLELLSSAAVLVAAPQSSFSYAAHARGLSVPAYGSFAPTGKACAMGAGSQAGMLTLGRLYTGCRDVGWSLQCAEERDECLGVVFGQNRVGRCLQEVAPCWTSLSNSLLVDGRGLRRAEGGSGRSREGFSVRDYLVDLNHSAFYHYWWVRHGGVISLDFDHDPFPVCWPAPAYST